jgi:NADH-quinone oxidoreductase subunit F
LHERHPAETPLISKRWGIKDSHKIDVYLQHEGYQALEKALKEMTPEAIIEEVKKSSLRGRGGAGFPTGMKWSFVPKDSPKPKYVICNADESEPGTCKDRPLMEMDPHQMIEGMVIAGRAIGSHQGFIYIRGEYRYVLDIVDAAIAEAYACGYLGKNIRGSGFDFDLLIHTGAGGNCEKIWRDGIPQGKRATRTAAISTSSGCTDARRLSLAQNAEAVPPNILSGKHANRGTLKNGGTFVCVAGHANKPSIEIPLMNTKSSSRDGRAAFRNKKIKAVIGEAPPADDGDEIDVAMDYDSVAKAGSMLARRHGGDGRRHLWWTWRGASCTTRTILRMVHPVPRGHELAAQNAGTLSCGIRATGRHRLDRGPGEKHAGAHVLSARRRRRHADDQHHEEVAW